MTEAIPAPGAAQRVQRTAGQIGAVTVVLDLVVAFGWVGADGWDPAQTTAVFAVAAVAASAAQNVIGHYRQNAANQQEVAPIQPAPPSGAARKARP